MCGMDVHVENGEIVKVEGMREHPMNQGSLCPKGAAVLEYVNSPNRLKYPMKKENGVFKRISWDEAIDIIAARLSEIKEKYGARALAVMRGMNIAAVEPVAGYGLRQRFCDVYGTPNYQSVDSMCLFPHLMPYILTFGRFYGPDAPEKSKLIVLWARDVDSSAPMLGKRVRQAKKNGARVIVIDPRRIRAAKEADIYLQVRPGTDSALAFGMLNVIIKENLYDADFVKDWTTGFDKLVHHVLSYTPEEVEKITRVPQELIKEAARLLASVKPACINQGVASLDQQASGFHAARAICILQAITGNLDVPGGFVSTGGLRYKLARLHELLNDKAVGEDEYPLAYKIYGRPIGEGQGNVLPEVILTEKPYPIKALIADGTNPLLSWANSNKWREAFNKLDFLLATSLFPTETTEMADVVLPAASFLEISDVTNGYAIYNQIPYVMSRKKVRQFEEAQSSGYFWLKLAKKMGYDEYFPWEDTDEFINWSLEPVGLTVESLAAEDKAGGFFYGSPEYGRYIKKPGFLTPSKKVEIYSETMSKLGFDPLPVHIEPTESPISSPELAKEYPLILGTGPRSLESLQSEMHDLPKLQKLGSKSFVAEVHPDTAKEYGIEDGQMITIETKRGSIDMKAKVTEDIISGMVSIPVGRREANANLLTSEQPGSAVYGVPEFKALLCRVSRKSP